MQGLQDMDKGVAAHEGCHIYGFMDVKRVAAHLHMSVHMQDFMMLAEVRLHSNALIHLRQSCQYLGVAFDARHIGLCLS